MLKITQQVSSRGWNRTQVYRGPVLINEAALAPSLEHPSNAVPAVNRAAFGPVPSASKLMTFVQILVQNDICPDNAGAWDYHDTTWTDAK